MPGTALTEAFRRVRRGQMTKIHISIADPRWRAIEGLPALVRRAAQTALATADLPARLGDVSAIAVELADDAAIRALNGQFRRQDKATNVLSFPGFPSIDAALAATNAAAPKRQPIWLGDIILAYETVRREASEQGKPAKHHLTHLVVHGVLHLLGYDHEDSADAVRMEDLERRILATMDIPDPYLIAAAPIPDSDRVETEP